MSQGLENIGGLSYAQVNAGLTDGEKIGNRTGNRQQATGNRKDKTHRDQTEIAKIAKIAPSARERMRAEC